ncbi:MAG: 4-hydroxy-3-methylbut-2-enyl diphosphate reductase [Firmicutes bacterium ADurb.Bin354]|nr:MAG: 4-hydroxy-3-methylbut-2-enyl diphosphate reductase [Firmicutes bacterium ADurb.Bin354]
MAEVITAKTAGFCFGVKKAVDKAFEMAETGKEIYTYGPVIHNDEVVGELKAKGVKVLDGEEELSSVSSGTVILRSHGVSRHIMELLEEKNIDYVDVTCPFVKRIHDIVDEKSRDHEIVIVGNPNHPEVEGIVGWCRNGATVISGTKEAEAFEPSSDLPVCVVSQTTFNFKKFKEIVEIFSRKLYNCNIVNTICNATEKHQAEAREIAEAVDTMIVIGDSKSSNSRKLYEICKERCSNTYFVQTLEDLKLQKCRPVGSIGITAGASTPNNIIEEVQNYVRNDI